jgi:hypothetical protein
MHRDRLSLHERNGDDKARDAGAAPKVEYLFHMRFDQRHKLNRVGDMALPDIVHSGGTNQIDAPLPFNQEIDIGCEPRA